MMIYNDLVRYYEALHQESSPTAIQERVNALSSYIHDNAEALSQDLLDNSAHGMVYQDIKSLYIGKDLITEIERIQYNSELLKLEALSQDPGRLAQWLNEQQKTCDIERGYFVSYPSKVLDAFDQVIVTLWHKQFGSDLHKTLSKMVVTSLGLGDKKASEIGSLYKDGKIEIRVLAHLVNGKEIALKDLGLSLNELLLLAPHLQYVDAQDVSFKDDDEIQNFISECSKAYHLVINSDKIKEINKLPNVLESLDCRGCSSLENIGCDFSFALKELTLSNLTALKRLDCSGCTSLKTFTYSNLSALEHLEFSDCGSLKALDPSNLLNLKYLACSGCSSIKMFSLSNLVKLEIFHCFRCKSITTLNISNLPELRLLNCAICTSLTALECSNLLRLTELDCYDCASLRVLTLSNLGDLEELFCSNCPLLENIGAASLPSCSQLDHSGCTRLRQLPQLPNGCQVLSYNSIRFISFEVDPEDLTKHPLDVLCHLGDLILKDKRMPNISYLHSPGLDGGGLRRQLVTTLLKNLFEKGSPLSFTEEGIEGVLPRCSDLFDERQIRGFKTLGSLVALASLGSLPLGRCFRSNFYYALLNVDVIDEEKIYRLLHALPEGDKVTPEEIEENLSLILPVVLAAKEFQSLVGDEKLKSFRQLELKDFVNRVAGEEITLEAFENKAVFSGDDILKTKGYFQQFFNEYEKKDPQKLSDMIELFTSSRALGQENIKIFIKKEKDKESLFEMTTCFQQVTIPMYESYEKFKEKLFKTAEHVLGRFDKA